MWADLGCGDGVFTQGLLEATGRGTRVTGLDRDPMALRRLLDWAQSARLSENVSAVLGDFRRTLPLRGLSGLLIANGMHFVPDGTKEGVIRQLASAIVPGGQLILVEYNAGSGNPAVPHPLRSAGWVDVVQRAGLMRVSLAARTPSSFLGEMVAIVGETPPSN
jgi:SAM-dependent methyltransferase